MIRLKQSTASQEIPLGHFVDETDGKTAETALTINNTDIKLWKAGATSLADKNSGGATHMAGGVYVATLDATDTNTLGALVIFVHVAGALPVRVECEVLAANVYDAMVAGSDKLQVDTVEVAGTAQTARDLGANLDATVSSRLAAASYTAPPSTTQIADQVWDEVLAGHLAAGSTGEALNDAAAGGGGGGATAQEVWEYATRTLTSGVTLAAGQIAIKKNTALNNFTFLMRQSADHATPATGLTVTAQRSIDGGAFSACANSVSEVGNGVYKINLAASDLNGDVITLKFTASGADQRTITIVTQT